MRSFTVSRDTLDFLLARLGGWDLTERLEDAKRAGPIQSRSTVERFSLVLTEQELSRLNEALLDLLCRIGLDPDNEPNDVGRYIEGLIDSFGAGVE